METCLDYSSLKACQCCFRRFRIHHDVLAPKQNSHLADDCLMMVLLAAKSDASIDNKV